MRCDPEGSGCEPVYYPGELKLVLGGRAIGASEALLLVVDTSAAGRERLPNEVHRVDLETGAGKIVYRAPPQLYVTDIDWIGDE